MALPARQEVVAAAAGAAAAVPSRTRCSVPQVAGAVVVAAEGVEEREATEAAAVAPPSPCC
jgi:hypothetical protein